MKYTLGRAALPRAHHMLLMHHNFSTHRHMKNPENLNGPVSKVVAPKHWLWTRMRYYQGATRNCSLPVHTTHSLLQTHACVSVQGSSRRRAQCYTQKWQYLFSHQLYTSHTKTITCFFGLPWGLASPPAFTVCCHLRFCWTKASKAGLLFVCPHTSDDTHGSATLHLIQQAACGRPCQKATYTLLIRLLSDFA